MTHQIKNPDNIYIKFNNSFRRNYSEKKNDDYLRYNTVLKQNNFISYTANDFWELICLLQVFHFVIGKKEHYNIYPAFTSLNEFMYDEYEINPKLIFSLPEKILFPINPKSYQILPYKENSLRVIATVAQRIKEFYAKTSDTLSLYSPAQRKDSEEKNLKRTPRYYIHGDTLHSALILFRWYDGRDFSNRTSQRNIDRLPRKTHSCSLEGYINCINYVLNSNDTLENLYATIDINKHMKFLYLICFDYYMALLSNERLLEQAFKSCNISYKEALSLDTYFVSSFKNDKELMSNIFSLQGVIRLEYFYTYLCFITSVHDTTKNLDVYFAEAKKFCLSEEKQHPIYKIINKSINDISNVESQTAYKQLIETLQSEIYTNKCWLTLYNYIQTICTYDNGQMHLSKNSLFAHIESDEFFKLISPYFFN